ncbi:hypothetical protein A2526_00220 [candidate division WOR-1 bacterium RIFOXYD2_FULL_36_8]|uniref:AMP-activated protein kinase glycogen-binding domain-containing protein n=1 Tax=candidate division WOR-1 bacterium RIFOXYB2_FULL_36_35 TaxID=1802578 RepID=A0A1F4S4C0_UNCSA|nr:MAG: hypothetical protein A2230_00920 [candidate division WOR-1 bacterium RIFOXYA2_FULL_36_21]OGC14244.1 MAG: hypothetical protein A2282_06635 [candidate division WOR-1 bacterium RIFOXYA12_FULL_36_13]OGC15249.1 MAG: hypothetical protein A2290_03130 [candidate division WOR-1 bacterium RIFOXYB2_FULL_36_35]OGC38260.1 MAG: hypothetical protein A2526_00220 [candidate division WOR-1 bacterium RIFOXYD2_FULL_36_8]
MSGKRIKFTFKDLDGKFRKVYLAGDFTDWGENAIVMNRKGNGEWVVTKSLTFGEHEYKFVADGKWIPDPRANKKKSALGEENSVIKVD